MANVKLAEAWIRFLCPAVYILLCERRSNWNSLIDDFQQRRFSGVIVDRIRYDRLVPIENIIGHMILYGWRLDLALGLPLAYKVDTGHSFIIIFSLVDRGKIDKLSRPYVTIRGLLLFTFCCFLRSNAIPEALTRFTNELG